MEIPEDIQRAIIGELITREKYKFLPCGLLAEIVREAFKELEEAKP